MKKLNKFTAVLLCVALMLCAMPIVSANTATNTENLYNSELSQTAEETVEPYIVGELTQKRTENTKHFLMSDRTVTAAVYNKPVHYKDGDTWENIDNSFSETEDSSELQNKSNSVKTKFSKKSNGKKLVTVTKDKFTLSWWLEDADKVDAVVSQSDNTTSDDMSALKNIEGSVTYPEIQENADLQYILSGSDIKENIILKNKNAPLEYTFTYEAKKLKYRTNEQNQIEFYDESDPENTVFIIDAPYMYDSEKSYSEDIETQITETNKGLTLTLIPDKEWLLSEDRVYPVVIDPPIISSQDAREIWDITLQKGQTSAISYTRNNVLVGSDTSGNVYRTLLKFINLPTIDKGGIIVNAKFNITAYVKYYNTDPDQMTRPTDDIQVNIHKVTVNWPEQSAIWSNNANNYNSIIEDYFIYNDTDYHFTTDITKLVSEWYQNPDSNYGIMIKAADESVANHVMQFISSDWGIGSDKDSVELRPVLSVNYRSCVGLEDYWSYSTQSLGDNCTGYINNYNGNLTFLHFDTSFNSEATGYTVSHTYNSELRDTTGKKNYYGYGWNLNVVQKFEAVADTKTPYAEFVYTDGDGTRHYFVKDSNGNIIDEDGLGYTYSEIS